MKDKDMRGQFVKFLESHTVFVDVIEETFCEILARLTLLEEKE